MKICLVLLGALCLSTVPALDHRNHLRDMDQCVRNAAALDYADLEVFALTRERGYDEDSAYMATLVFHMAARMSASAREDR